MASSTDLDIEIMHLPPFGLNVTLELVVLLSLFDVTLWCVALPWRSKLNPQHCLGGSGPNETIRP